MTEGRLDERVLTVSALNQLIKSVLDTDPIFQGISLVGEVSSLRSYRNLTYLTFIDGEAQISAISYQPLPSEIQIGAQVKAFGKLIYFHKKGQIQFQVMSAKPVGSGPAADSFLALKQKLEKAGLFDAKHKKPLPEFPNRIVLITASPSAALADFLVFKERLFPHVHVTLIPAQVQGEGAVPSILAALALADQLADVDMIVLMRGGGSVEDLACFNSEVLVQAIFDTKTPVLSAIGHQIDVSLTDYVADLFVPTPTAAAQHIAQPFVQLRGRVALAIQSLSELAREPLDMAYAQCQDAMEALGDITSTQLKEMKQKASELMTRYQWVNPIRPYEKGYSRTRNAETGRAIQSVGDVEDGQLLETQLRDGVLKSKLI